MVGRARRASETSVVLEHMVSMLNNFRFSLIFVFGQFVAFPAIGAQTGSPAGAKSAVAQTAEITWTSIDGRTLKASWLATEQDQVVLKRGSSGQMLRIPLAGLAPKSQAAAKLYAKSSLTYTWSVFAGKPGEADCVDGTADTARFNKPSGLVVDGNEGLFVADCDNNAIRHVSAAGAVTTIAGIPKRSGWKDGPADQSLFYHPSGLVLDSHGNLFVVEFVNATIRKIAPDKVVTTLAGNARKNSYGNVDGNGSEARFFFPNSAAIDGNDNIYVADFENNTVRKITPQGDVTTLAGKAREFGKIDGEPLQARFSGPRGLVVDQDGNILLSETGNSNIRKINPNGMVSTLAGKAGEMGHADGRGEMARFDRLEGVAIDVCNNVYAIDGTRHIRKISPDGNVETISVDTGLPPSRGGPGFSFPYCVAITDDGVLYVADSGNHVIFRGVPTK